MFKEFAKNGVLTSGPAKRHVRENDLAACSWSYKLTLLGAFTVGYLIFYTYPNLFPLSPPRYLPLLAIDRQTPFLPWTFVIYTSDYVLILLPFFWLKAPAAFNAYARMLFAVLIGCGLFFLFLPTAYPRPPYPKVDNLLIAGLMNFIAAADNPTNSFPSMHVALTGAASWAVRVFGRRIHLLFWIWTLAVFASTMTTKQHYFVDILGGIAVMVSIAALEWAVFEKKRK